MNKKTTFVNKNIIGSDLFLAITKEERYEIN